MSRPQRWNTPPAATPVLSSAESERGAATVLPFRRRAVKPRRRRRSLWVRLLRPLATAVLLVALPAGLGLWVLTSPRFALGEVRVSGGERVSAAWVEERLRPLTGHNLLTLPLDEVETALEGHPWIAAVSLRKELPDGLGVEVTERRAVALVPVAGDDRLWLADADGDPIVPAPAGAEEEFLLVVPRPDRADADGVAGAVAAAGELARSRPVWAAGLERVEVLGDGAYRLRTSALPFPLLVRGGAVAVQADRLHAALPALTARLGGIRRADLRFPDRLILLPGADTAARRSAADEGDARSHEGHRKKVG